MAEHDLFFKVVIVGECNAGKTSLLMRFADNVFHEEKISVNIDTKKVLVDACGKKIMLSIWDTAGQESFRSMTASYYRGANGVLLCYDSSDPESFQEVHKWYSEVEKNAMNNINIVLVGCKSDLECVVSQEDLESKVEYLRCKHATCSAKTGEGVPELFKSLAEEITTTHQAQAKRSPKHANVKIGGSSGGKSSCC
eukprot:TRINITY_DN7396_c0_g1_i1.p1 TRINITY_DN7396_c0_g1~~TRINITY_DN7396_c0_g1_i1.p1  ORF type:complete len:196 (+),score=63.44 TRINITY_DN7396_c0_g1_i1:157-744(+)